MRAANGREEACALLDLKGNFCLLGRHARDNRKPILNSRGFWLKELSAMGALAAVCQSSSSLASYPSRFALLSRLLVSKGGRGVTRRWISSSGAPIRFQGGRTFQEDPAQCAFHSDRRRRKMVGRLFSVKGAGWTESESPYDVLGVSPVHSSNLGRACRPGRRLMGLVMPPD